MTSLSSVSQELEALNNEYTAIHLDKEEKFWTYYMGTSSDSAAFAAAEDAWTRFAANPKRIPRLRELHAILMKFQEDEKIRGNSRDAANIRRLLTICDGWLNFFQSHSIEDSDAAEMKAGLISYESEMFARNRESTPTYTAADGSEQKASLPVLRSIMKTSESPQVRRSAYEALLAVERRVLDNGLIELITMRNRFARKMGHANYFEYASQKTERLSTEELFSVLSRFEELTRDSNQALIDRYTSERGEEAVRPEHIGFTMSGSAANALDPYLPFSRSLRRWVNSFGRMGIRFHGADLTLDLLERDSKHPNGFMHGPRPAVIASEGWIPARINFTSNARPGQPGSGADGLRTLFHEGGHAAHFSNVSMPAPCFSQEFAPTSMALAETQSMFCDSVLEDADWLMRYATDASGNFPTAEITESIIREKQETAVYTDRMMLVVPYFERALYEADEAQLTVEWILELARKTERFILGTESPRPVLSIPHLLTDDSACSYQGYLLANMAVYQVRDFFTRHFGYITDNPAVGPLMEKHFWQPGNAITLDQGLRSLTGEGFSPLALAAHCNMSSDQAWTISKKTMDGAVRRAERVIPVIHNLDATIRIVDGTRNICSNMISNEEMFEKFENFIENEYP